MSNTPLERKHEILNHLHTHLRRRTARRRFARAAVASTGAASVLAIAMYLALPGLFIAAPIAPLAHNHPTHSHQLGPDPAGLASPVDPDALAHTPPAHAPGSAVTVRIAHSEPLPTTPCETSPTATVCILSDDQLLAALAEAGQPSGLVRTGGQAFIVPREPDRQQH